MYSFLAYPYKAWPAILQVSTTCISCYPNRTCVLDVKSAENCSAEKPHPWEVIAGLWQWYLTFHYDTVLQCFSELNFYHFIHFLRWYDGMAGKVEINPKLASMTSS